MSLGILILTKSLVILLIGFGLSHLMRGASAACRHFIWTVTMAGLVLLPFVSIFLPALEVEALPAEIALLPAARSAATLENRPFPEISTVHPSQKSAEQTASNSGEVGQPVDATKLILLLWAAGVVVMLGKDLHSRIRLHRLAAEARPAGGRMVAAVRDLREKFAMKRKVRVLEAETPVAMTWGLVYPIILLPAKLREWPQHRRNVVLIHEFGHVYRKDDLANHLGSLALALYWFNPLMWLACRNMLIEREKACDDFVLNSRMDASEYAEELLFIGRRLVSPVSWGSAFRQGHLAARLESILDERVRRGSLGGRTVLWTLGMVLMLFLPFAALRILPTTGLAHPQESSIQQAREGLKHPDWKVRERSAWLLGMKEAALATSELEGALDDPEPQVRAIAAWALGEIKQGTALPALARHLEDDDEYAREMIVRAIGELEEPLAIEILEPLLADPSPVVRSAVVWTLGEMETSTAGQDVLTKLKDPDPFVREMAARVLEKGDARATRELLSVLQVEEERSVKLAIIAALGEGGDPLAVDGLVSILSDPDPAVRTASIRSLGRLGDSRAVSPLLERLRDPTPSVRWMATWALDEINSEPIQ